MVEHVDHLFMYFLEDESYEYKFGFCAADKGYLFIRLKKEGTLCVGSSSCYSCSGYYVIHEPL